MRKVNKLGKRAAAMALAISLTLSTAAPVLAVDADEVETPAAQTEQQEEEPASSEEEQPTEEPASSKEEQPTEEPAESEEKQPEEEPASSEEEQPTEEPAESGADSEEPAESEEPADSDEVSELPAESEERKPVVVLPDQLPEVDTDSKEEASGSEAELPAADGDVDTYKVKWHKHPINSNCQVKNWIVKPTCTKEGSALVKCADPDCDYQGYCTMPALGHDFKDAEWIEEKATCTTAGKRYQVCKRDGCNEENVDEDYTREHPALGHDFKDAEWIEEKATCTTAGKRYQVCKRDGCNEENVDEDYTREHPALGHVWGEYVDDDKPGCQQQTESKRCTVCGARGESRNLKNFGSDGNPLPHKYTTYTPTEDSITVAGVASKYVSTCDYGCGTTKEFVTLTEKDARVDVETKTAMNNVKLNDKSADDYINDIIDKALQNAQKAVKNAKTKEEALDALDQISSTVKAELSTVNIKVVGVGGDVKISEADLNNALKPLDDTVADLKKSLNDSFLSQDTITDVVNKLADDVQGSSAPKTGIRQILYNTVYDTIYNIGASDDNKKTTDNTAAIENMVLQLAKDVVESEKGWKDLTDSLVDDAVNLAVDELMKDDTYAMLLKTKLGAATLEEVKAEVKNQLVNDPKFMDQVRSIANKAVTNAQKGVNAGWSNEKIMNRLQADLLPDVTNLISDQVSKLGESTGTIVDKKVSDTVHKFLPGKLGDWVSEKIGGKVSGAVTGKVDDLNKQVTDLISTTIKQLTCTHAWGDRETLKNATCTEKGQTGIVCRKCGKVKDKKDDIEPTGHTPVTDAAVAPTETKTGLTEGSHCSVCGAVLTAQEVVPMLDPSIDTWFSRAATTEADAKAAGYDSVAAANAALDAALTAAGFDPANAEHFTVQVNSSIGVLPNNRFPDSGVTGKLTLPEGTRGKTAQTYYVVQMFTADTRFHKAGDVVVTPVSIDNYAKTGLEFTVYTEAIMGIAWKAQ